MDFTGGRSCCLRGSSVGKATTLLQTMQHPAACKALHQGATDGRQLTCRQ
jgi:hypothetical protein